MTSEVQQTPALAPENWLVGPYNRWAFSHLDEVVETAAVRRSERSVPLVHMTDASALGAAGLGVSEAQLRDSFSEALLVAVGNEIVLEWYRDRDPLTRHLSMSVTKSVISLLVGSLSADCGISRDDLLEQHLPELAGTGYAGATLQHALDMTVSVGFDETYDPPTADVEKLDAASGWAPPTEGGPRSLHELVLSIPSGEGRHGERFAYRSPNVDVVAMTLERLTHTPLAQLIEERLWRPLGTEADAQLALDPSGQAVADGGLAAAACDFVRLGRLLLDGGAVGRVQIVPESWIAEAWRPLTTPLERARASGVPAWLEGERSYHDWWYGGSRCLRARGTHGQLIAVDETADVVVVWLSSWSAHHVPALAQQQRSLLDTLLDHVRRGS